MGKYRLSELEKNPDYQHFIQVRRPQIKQQERENQERMEKLVHKRMVETLTMAAALPDDERKQEILTPAQQLRMRNEVAKCQSVSAAVKVINRYIFGGDDGLVDKVEINPKIRDPYSLDYAVPHFG